MERQLTMMTAGPVLTIDLVSDGPWVMEAVSPVDITGNGWGREFVYVEEREDNPPTAEDSVLIETALTPHGLTAEIYRRIEEPLEWTLRWRLVSGVLYSHLREEDGLEYAPIVTRAVEVLENAHGMPPTLLLNPPLERMVRLQPGYHEYVVLNDPRTDTWVHIRRPSTLKNDQLRTVARYTGDERPLVFRGAKGGFEVIVASSTSSNEAITELARSLRVTVDAS